MQEVRTRAESDERYARGVRLRDEGDGEGVRLRDKEREVKTE